MVMMPAVNDVAVMTAEIPGFPPEMPASAMPKMDSTAMPHVVHSVTHAVVAHSVVAGAGFGVC